MLTPREWCLPYSDARSGVPDMTPSKPYQSKQTCHRQKEFHFGGIIRRVYFCTRSEGHFGRHAAGDGGQVIAVWEQSRLEREYEAAERSRRKK